MLNKEGELVLVGLLNPDNILTDKYTLSKIREIISDYCLLDPIYDTLFSHFVDQGLLKPWAKNDMDNEEVSVKDVIRILKTPKFIKDVPKFLNARQTRENINTVLTAMMLLDKQYLEGKAIAKGLNAYFLTCRERNTEILKLDYKNVMDALRICGRAMSEKIFKMWVDRMKGFLECDQPAYKEFQTELLNAKENFENAQNMTLSFDPSSLSHAERKEKKKDKKPEKEQSFKRQRTTTSMAETQSGQANSKKEIDKENKEEEAEALKKKHKPVSYIFGHEFLILLTNSRGRVEKIEQKHKMDYKPVSTWPTIYHWELEMPGKDGKSRVYQNHIPLITDQDLADRCPQQLLKEALDQEVEDHNLKFEGKEKKIRGVKGGQQTFDGICEDRQNKQWDRCATRVHLKKAKEAERRKYIDDYDMLVDDDGMMQIKHFFETYIDLQKYDLKTILELKKERQENGGQQASGPAATPTPSDDNTCMRIPYDPKNFIDEDGAYDFTRAPGYDESIVRNNLNKVKRPSTAVVSKPTLQKIIEVVPKPNYIGMNKDGMRKVHGINQRRMAYMQSEMRKTERVAPSSCNRDRVRPQSGLSARSSKRKNRTEQGSRMQEYEPDGPTAYYSHTDSQKVNQAWMDAKQVKASGLYDGVFREIQYVNKTVRGDELYNLNKQNSQLKHSLNHIAIPNRYMDQHRIVYGDGSSPTLVSESPLPRNSFKLGSRPTSTSNARELKEKLSNVGRPQTHQNQRIIQSDMSHHASDQMDDTRNSEDMDNPSCTETFELHHAAVQKFEKSKTEAKLITESMGNGNRQKVRPGTASKVSFGRYIHTPMEKDKESALSPYRNQTTAAGMQSVNSLHNRSPYPQDRSSMKKKADNQWVKNAGSTAETPHEYYRMMQQVRTGKNVDSFLTNRAKSQHEASKPESKKRPGSSFATARQKSRRDNSSVKYLIS